MLPLLQRPLESSECGIAIACGGEDAGDIVLRHEAQCTQLIQLGDEPIRFSRLSGCSVSLGLGCDGYSAPPESLMAVSNSRAASSMAPVCTSAFPSHRWPSMKVGSSSMVLRYWAIAAS